jgi:signal-transduction protein with cAMP-binding, CBS, and nucleotidyltransferase domain
MKTAEEVILQKRRHNNFIGPEVLVIDALKQLSDVNLSYLVVKDGDSVKGIFSERDYARKVILQGKSSKETKVKEIMTIDLPEVQVYDSVEKCMNLLAAQGMRYILVKDKDKFEGVITIHDLLREVLLHGDRVFDHTGTRTLIDINEHPHRVY